MKKKRKIKIGQKVRAIVWAWREDDLPSEKNFAFGIVAEIINRSKNAVYVRLKGLDRIIPIDRIQAI